MHLSSDNVDSHSQLIKKVAYLTPLLIALLPILGVAAAQITESSLIMIGLTPVVLFIIVPILDWIIGRDPSNPSPIDSASLATQRYYRALPICVCLHIYSRCCTALGWLRMSQCLPL